MRKLSGKRSAFAACASVIEQLEKRALLSAVIGSDGTLTITGTSGADTIDVSFKLNFTPGQSPGQLGVFDDGIEYGLSSAAIKRVVINAGDGNDNIAINGSETDSDPSASAINFTVVDGNGQDTVDSYVDDTGFVQKYKVPAPAVSLTIGDGNDTASVQGGTTATIIAGNGNDYLFASAITDPLTVSMTAGNGNSIIQGIAGNALLTINANVGTGHDEYENANDPDIFVYAHTTDGQTSGALTDEIMISGHLYDGVPANSVNSIPILLDVTHNGSTDPDVASSVTDYNGDFEFNIANSTPDIASTYDVHALFIDTSPADLQETATAGVGFSGDYFAQVATADTPVVIGTTGSYKNLGNTNANAVDYDLDTFFDAPVASGGYVGLDYGSPQVFTKISYAPRPGFASRMLQGLFQGSNSSDFSNAVTLYQVTTVPAVGVLTTVNIGNKGAFRYVRYIGATNDYCNIAEMQLILPEKLTGIPIGTAGSYQGQGNTIANVFDGFTDSYFDAPVATGAWVGQDLGTAKAVYEVQFAPRPGFDQRMVGGQFQASNTADFSSGVVTLATITTQPQAYTLTTLMFSNSTAYRYYRYIGPANSYCNIAELEFEG